MTLQFCGVKPDLVQSATFVLACFSSQTVLGAGLQCQTLTESAVALQLQQESLQHATALQGLAQRAEAVKTQMHDLQRLMEAMQGALRFLCFALSAYVQCCVGQSACRDRRPLLLVCRSV